MRNEKVTAPYLAERFEVSRRTICRDIEDICKAGIPVVTTQGFGGGICIAEGYKIDKTLFTEQELKAIFTGLKGLDSVSGVSHTKSLINKLSSKNGVVASDTQPVLIDLASHYKSNLIYKIEFIKSAIYEKRCISFLYYYPKGEMTRIVEPCVLVFRWSAWYLLCYCLEKNDFRLFKLNRLWELKCLEQRFEPRAIPEEALSSDSYFTDEIQLVALFEPEVKYRLIDEYGIDSFSENNGKLLFKTGFTNKEYLVQWILGYGDKVEIIEPKELKSEIVQTAQNILQKYRGT